MKKVGQLIDDLYFYTKSYPRTFRLGFIVFSIIQIFLLFSVIFLIFNTHTLNKNLNSFSDNYSNFYYSTTNNFREINISLTEHNQLQSSLSNELNSLKGTQDFSNVIREVSNGVVLIFTDIAQGTGFFINSEGFVVTNYHVIENGKEIYVETLDKVDYPATLIAFDSIKDIALLHINLNNNTYLLFANSDKLVIGQKVIAIGNPYGLSFSTSEGVISALKRQGINNLQVYIQTDVSINPGNSGGPLLDTNGKVIGINNFKIMEGEGLGFALESNEVKSTVNKLAGFSMIK